MILDHSHGLDMHHYDNTSRIQNTSPQNTLTAQQSHRKSSAVLFMSFLTQQHVPKIHLLLIS